MLSLQTVSSRRFVSLVTVPSIPFAAMYGEVLAAMQKQGLLAGALIEAISLRCFRAYALSPRGRWSPDSALISAMACSMRKASLPTNSVRCSICCKGTLPVERRNHTKA